MTQAIAVGFAGLQQSFQSLLYQEYLPDATKTGVFPYDVHYLTPAEIDDIAESVTKTGKEIWPPARIAAYRGTDVIAKRAAVSVFLWQRYTESPVMSLDTLKLWVEVERLDGILNPPNWFVVQSPGQDVDRLWRDHLGAKRAAAERRHQDLLRQLLKRASGEQS